MSYRSLSMEAKRSGAVINHTVLNRAPHILSAPTRQGLLNTPPLIQPKLKIGAPNDRYEQEADRVVDQVMRMPAPGSVQTQTSSPQIQRLCPECEEEIHRQPEEEEEFLNTKPATSRTPTVSAETAAAVHSLKGGGQALPKSERNFFEPRFNKDFSWVRIHSDNRAHQAAQSVQARAFTHKGDIVFNRGEYSPSTESGRKLLAHELTHVVQQKGASPVDGNELVNRLPVYRTSNIPMIQLQRFRDCTPGITGAAMTQTQLDNLILGARMAAEFMVIVAESAVRRIIAGTATAAERAAFTAHFGAPNAAQRNTILIRFGRISRRLSNNRLFICNTAGSSYCSRAWCAYQTCPGMSYATHLCPGFFQNPPACGRPDRVLTLIHETAHAAGACNDVYPGAVYPPANAQNNAPSYSGFADAFF